jgi:membrane protease subunit HflK
MAWNDKGGGPWGSPPGGNEPRRPPSNGKGPAGKGPNDFEAILRQGQEKLSEWWPGAHGGSMIALLIGAVVVIWLLSGIYRVDPNEQAVVQRFGALARTESLGLHYHLPTPIETVTIVDVTRRNQTEVGSRNSRESTDAGTMLTGDSNIVELGFVIVWQVRDPVKYLFKVADPADVLQRAAESAMREVIGQTDVQLALNEGRGQIETSSAAILQTPVVDAFHDVQRARADLEQQRNDAEKYRNDIVPRARGEAQKIIQDAGGYKDKTIAEATGEAAQFVSVLDAYKAARDVTARRMYIETMETILAHSRKIIIDPNADGKNGVVPYLPLPGLSAPASASPAPVSPAKVQ